VEGRRERGGGRTTLRDVKTSQPDGDEHPVSKLSPQSYATSPPMIAQEAPEIPLEYLSTPCNVTREMQDVAGTGVSVEELF
jgi:hypothetical protein